MQLTKIGAIKSNAQWAIVFDAGATPGRYFICSDDGANDTWDGAGGLDDMGADADFRVTKGRYAIHWNVANDVVTNNTRYYGYFEPYKKYSYGSNIFVRDTNGSWDGNFLNWLCMRRIDVARKVLMGGLATARTGGGNQTNIGEAPSETGHGQFVRCISDLTNELKKAGIISGKEKGAIQSLAAKAKLAP